MVSSSRNNGEREQDDYHPTRFYAGQELLEKGTFASTSCWLFNNRCLKKIKIRRNKYLNNRVEGDNRFVEWRIQNMLGFKSFESASRTLTGIEIVRMIKKGTSGSSCSKCVHNVLHFSCDMNEDENNISWARNFWEAVQPYSSHRVYVNVLGVEGEDRVKEAYGKNYPRLTALKSKYDPGNLFRLNQNIKPSKS